MLFLSVENLLAINFQLTKCKSPFPARVKVKKARALGQEGQPVGSQLEVEGWDERYVSIFGITQVSLIFTYLCFPSSP